MTAENNTIYSAKDYLYTIKEFDDVISNGYFKVDWYSANVYIKYFDPEMPKIEVISVGDWIDLRSAVELDYKAGEAFLIPLGITIKLPNATEAIMAPRSSTFKKYGIIQTNSIGVIDNSYCGDNDQWFMPVYALRDGHIDKYDRICQFRIFNNQDFLRFTEVDSTGDKDRGGFGSTGK
jgi:dUTP pyrophosphatase